MDSDALVESQIDGGGELIDALTSRGFDVSVACWVKEADEGRWAFYVVTTDVKQRPAAEAYQSVHAVLSNARPYWPGLSDIKLISPDNIIGKDLLDMRGRYPGVMPTRSRRSALGSVRVEEIYLYPETIRGFYKIKSQFPSARIVSFLVPTDKLTAAGFYRSLVGMVNAADFDGNAPGTMLFMGPRYSSTDPIARLLFIYRPEGWNTLFRASTGEWEEVVHAETQKKLYDSADFSPLASLKAG